MTRRWGDVRVGNVIENQVVCVRIRLGNTNVKGGERREAKGVSMPTFVEAVGPLGPHTSGISPTTPPTQTQVTPPTTQRSVIG